MSEIKINTPLTEDIVTKLKAGDKVLISGTIYTARDAAHKRLVDLIEAGNELPFDLKNQIIYYVGPTPPKPGKVIGSAGPTTSTRMDAYTPILLKYGLKGMIGKGLRSQQVKDAICEYKSIYFAAIGGAAAVISNSIVKAELVAFEDLGTEAIRKLTVKDFPAVVINDYHGGDLYLDGRKKYLEAISE